MGRKEKVAPGNPGTVVEMRAVSKAYRAKADIVALDNVSISFPPRTFTAVMGPSGSGKSTLMHCAAGLDKPTSGHVFLDGVNMAALKEPKLTVHRRRNVGFVFQAFNLIDSLTVWHNVLLPMRLAGMSVDRKWARELLDRVGLGGREDDRPAQLSGGQQQRVALTRALVTRPRVIFADEPTGALDTASGQEVLQLLREAVNLIGTSVIMVTHDPNAAAWADRVVFLADGRLNGELIDPTAEAIADRLTRKALR